VSYEYHKDDKADRSSWVSGPWDSEPDFYQWITSVGYQAWTYRLKSGVWAVSIIAPHPVGSTSLLKFCHSMRDKRHNQMDHQLALISKTDREDIGEFHVSMEHWESPGPSGRIWYRGPYKTLEEVKQIAEDVAQDIFDLNGVK
jgi:hypothetical protein